jgi:hypothetical protein
MRHPFGHFDDRMSCAGDGLVGGPVAAIASQKLPSERGGAGGAKIMEIGVGIPPIALVWHLSYPHCRIIFRSATPFDTLDTLDTMGFSLMFSNMFQKFQSFDIV